jgi:predicted esterase
LELIESLIKEGTADPRRLFLLGFSQSCALNYRFAFTHAEVLRGVIGICGGLPGDWENNEAYRQTKAGVFHLSGARDEFYPPDRTRDYEANLRSRASEVKFQSYDAGHEIIQPMRDDLRVWLKEQSAA